MKRAFLILFSLLVLCTTVVAQDILTPTGEIAFASNRDGIYQIYTMDADGSNARILIENDIPVYTPVWSPDGSKLAYVADNEGKYPLFVWDIEQPTAVKLADDALNLYSLSAWSPDSEYLSYANFMANNQDVEFHSAATNGQQNVVVGLDPRNLALIQYMPDQSLLISQSGGVFTANVRGSGLALVTDHFSYPAALSPASDRIVGYNSENETVDISDFNGENVQTIVDAQEKDLLFLLDIGWSPDEQYIWGVGNFINDDSAANATEYRVFIAKSDGTAYHVVNAVDTQITWSPDSQFISYTGRDSAGEYQIFTSRPDGADETQITTEGSNSQPAWRPE
jgi:TolB protein